MTDRISEIRSVIQLLQKESGNPGDRVKLRVDKSDWLSAFVAITFPDRNYTVIVGPVDSGSIPKEYKIPAIRGMEISLEEREHRIDSPLDIILELRQHDAQDIFILFIARLCEVIENSENKKDAILEVIKSLERWKDFFSILPTEWLTENQQTGLYGELYFFILLYDTSIPLRNILRSWTGAKATNQDYQFGEIALEIKTTTANDTSRFKVSNIRQLDDSNVENMYLGRLALDVRQGKNKTLPELINTIRELIRSEATDCSIEFEEKLLYAGYLDIHADKYQSRSYEKRFLDMYKISEDFPRILEDSLPDGISNVNYTVSLDGCGKFKTQFDKMILQLVT